MAAHQAPPSLGFSSQEQWSGLPFPSPMPESEKGKWSRSVMSDSLGPHGLQPTRLLCPWDFPDKSTGVGCHCLLHCRLVVRQKLLDSIGLWNLSSFFNFDFFFFISSSKLLTLYSTFQAFRGMLPWSGGPEKIQTQDNTIINCCLFIKGKKKKKAKKTTSS